MPGDLAWHLGLEKFSWEMMLEGIGIGEHKLIS